MLGSPCTPLRPNAIRSVILVAKSNSPRHDNGNRVHFVIVRRAASNSGQVAVGFHVVLSSATANRWIKVVRSSGALFGRNRLAQQK